MQLLRLGLARDKRLVSVVRPSLAGLILHRLHFVDRRGPNAHIAQAVRASETVDRLHDLILSLEIQERLHGKGRKDLPVPDDAGDRAIRGEHIALSAGLRRVAHIRRSERGRCRQRAKKEAADRRGAGCQGQRRYATLGKPSTRGRK